MKKAELKALGLFYFIGDEPSPFEGLPVFAQKEVDLLKRSRDTITMDILRRIYDLKLTTGSSLEDISLLLAEEAEFNQSPREEIGYNQAPLKKGSPGEIAMQYVPDIVAKLKGVGAKTRQEKEDEQKELF